MFDNSKSDRVEDPKKLREECSGSCKADAEHVFAERLNDSSFLNILFNCSKGLGKSSKRYVKLQAPQKNAKLKAKNS